MPGRRTWRMPEGGEPLESGVVDGRLRAARVCTGSVPDTLRRRYDLVYDGGSIEHVFNLPVALRNCMDMLAVGGHYICNTATNNYNTYAWVLFVKSFLLN